MAITIPNVFVAGTRIESAPVNANFAALSNALDKTGDTITGNMAVGTGITIDGLDISTVPQSGGAFNPNSIVFTNVILGAATTSGIRLDLESGTLAVREGDDSAYGPMLASVYNVPTGGSVNFNEGSAALTWDTTESTANLALSASVDHKIGTQELVRCVNRTGTAIAKGKAVYIVGAHGNRPQIALADASDESTAATTLGITAESIADTGEGFVCVTGMLRGLNTNHLTEGQIVWLSETAGELTSTRPTQPAHGVFMGLCVRQQPGTSGILYISVVNGLELEELHDVLITTPSANQILKRNSGNTLWVNSSGAALTKTDDTNVTLTLGGSASTALVNAASLTLGWTGTLAAGRLNSNVVQAVTNDTNVTGSISTQTLTLGWTGQLALSRGGTGASTAQAALNTLAGAVTSGQYLRGNGTNIVLSALQTSDLSGTVGVSAGGTGQTTYTDGQLLIGNSVGNTLTKSTLTAGSNIAITNGNGSITISATAGGGTVTSVNGTGTVNGITLTGTVTSTGNLTLGGTLSNVSLTSQVTGTLPAANGGTGQTSIQAAMNAFAGAVTSGYYLRGNGTNVVMSAIQAGDIPTLNQNTSGTAAGLSSTLAVSSGGTGQTTYTDGQLLIGNTATTSLSKATLTAGSGVTITNGNGTITISASGSGGTVTSVSGSAPIASSGGTTPTISLSAAYGDTINPYGSKTANYVLAAPDNTGGIPSFRALVANDIPVLNQNTTGTAAGLSATLAVASGGTGQTTYTDGQLLIGNSTGNTLTKATLTAGTGVTITNGAGAITINATGTGGTVTSVNGTGSASGLSLSGTVTTTGDLTLSGTVDSMSALAGSASAPSIAASGDTNTGIFFPAADTIAVTTGGTERLRVDSSGNLGLGVMAPGVPFDMASDGAIEFRQTRYTTGVAGAVNTLRKARGTQASPTAVASSDNIGLINFVAYGGTNYSTLSTIRSTVSTYTSDTNMTSHLSFLTTNASTTATERLRITGAGDVAIAATAKLLLDGVAATGNTYLTESAADTISIFTGGTERLRLTSSGDTAIPATAKIFLDGVAATGNTYLTESSADNISIFTNGTERVTIDSTGDLGIGVTAPGVALDIARDASVAGRITRYSTDASSPTWTLRKARGTQASPTVVAVSDDIATLAFSAYGGTTFSDVASIKATMNRVASNTDMGVDITIGSANTGTSALPKLKIAGNDVAFPTTGRMFFDMDPTTGAVTGATGIVWNGGSNQIAFHTGSSARFQVGNGGVGVAATAKILLDGTALTGDTYLTETSANQIAIFTGGSERLRLDGSGNVGINVTAFGTSAAGVLGLKNGTEPSTGPADTVQIYSVDRSAGNTIPGIRCEGTGVTDAGITNTTVTNKIAIKINGTVYYLLATTNAT